jgi:GlcNAc-PI de-N-acetylase
MMRRSVGLGQAQHAWRGWPGGDALPVIAPEILVPKPYRAVFISPHPDDESICLGGTIARLAMLKRSILLIAATDGSAHRSDPNRVGQAPATAARLTTWHTLQRLGPGRTMILRPGLDDGEIPGVERDLEWRLRGLLLPSDVVFATWRYDGHPDHDVVGRVAARACAALFIHLVEVPIRAWQWSFPGDRRIPWKRARRIFLSRAPRPHSRSLSTQHSARSRDGARLGRASAPEAALMRAARPYEIVFV